MITFLLAATTYALIGTLTGVRAYFTFVTRAGAAYKRKCEDHARRYPNLTAQGYAPQDYSDAASPALLIAVFWPAGIFFLLAIHLIARQERANAIQRENAAEQERYLAEARKELEGL